MTKRNLCVASLCLIGITSAGTANIVLEPTFEQKMSESELVIIGKVIAVELGTQGQRGSTATLAVSRTLKGKSSSSITVTTYHPVAELNPRCCVIGATYLMFLRHAVKGARLASTWGPYGMVRIGGAPGPAIRVIPEAEVPARPR